MPAAAGGTGRERGQPWRRTLQRQVKTDASKACAELDFPKAPVYVAEDVEAI